MEKIATLATSLEEGLGEEAAWAKVEDVKNLQRELDQEVTALRKNLRAQKQLWSTDPTVSLKKLCQEGPQGCSQPRRCSLQRLPYLASLQFFSLQRLSPSRQEGSCTRLQRSCYATATANPQNKKLCCKPPKQTGVM